MDKKKTKKEIVRVEVISIHGNKFSLLFPVDSEIAALKFLVVSVMSRIIRMIHSAARIPILKRRVTIRATVNIPESRESGQERTIGRVGCIVITG